MDLPLNPPFKPMLGRLARSLPRDGYLYEPKWDGFRCLAFRSREEVDLRSRHGRPLARYFPEVVETLISLADERFAIDGELVVVREGRFDFAALMGRLHPAATRVERLSRESPASLAAFDILALGDDDLTARPFEQRRQLLALLFAQAPPGLQLTPITDEPETALEWMERFQGAGIDGVMAKRRGDPYRPGARAMVKVKRERTADCVLAGFRTYLGEPLVASLLLGLYDEDDRLHHVGVVSSFPEARRRELFAELKHEAMPLAGHPWERGFLLAGGPMGRLPGAAGKWKPGLELDWTPLRPERVCEIAYDQVDDHRLRHPGRFRRWRPDREPRSCRLDQLMVEAAIEPARLLR